jgi:glycosyltransferase involved in cell wall biosynthesis
MARVKRPLETIQAFLAAAPPDWVLLCVGPPTPEVPFSKIEAMCAASGRRCICVGPIFGSALPDYFSAADLFLLLSHSENYGHSAAEALFQGVPVVISPDVGLGPYIKRYGGGFVSGGASFNDMCEALRSAMQLSPESLAEIGRTGKGWVERELSPVHFADRLNALCLSSGKRTQNRPGRSAIEAVCR